MRQLNAQRWLTSFLIVIATLINAGAQQAPRIAINPNGHSAKIQNIIFTPDGGTIITVSEDKTIRLWNTQTGEMIKKMESQMGDGPEGMLYASAISPDGHTLAVSGYTLTPKDEVYIALIDLTSSKQIATAIGHTGVVNSLAYTGDGKFLISGSDDGTIKIWNVNGSNYSLASTITAGGSVSYLSVNPVNNDIACAIQNKNAVQVYHITTSNGIVKHTLQSIAKHKAAVNKVAYSNDGQYLATSSSAKECMLWNSNGSLIKEFDINETINALCFSKDSKILTAFDVAGKGSAYGVPQGAKFTDFKGHDNTVFSAAFAPLANGQYMVASVGGNAHEIIEWNPINGNEILHMKGKGMSITNIAFGDGLELAIATLNNGKPDYKRLFNFNAMKAGAIDRPVPTAADNKNVSQLNAYSLTLPKGRRIQNNPDVDGRILDFTSDGNESVFVASDFSLKMYNIDGTRKKEFVGHNGSVRSLSISKDHRYMASASEDQTIILWKLDDKGTVPSLREVFPSEDWAQLFKSLPVDSLSYKHEKDAWTSTMAFMKANNVKAHKAVDDEYKNLGEMVVPYATLFLTGDNEWVVWTHKGYFACTSAGSQYFGWHVNQGVDKLAEFFAADQYFEILYRPDEIQKSINEGIQIEDILTKEGKRIFDLGRLHKPSAALFTASSAKTRGLVTTENTVTVTKEKSLPLTVDIYDGGGGVKEVNIYQNEKLIITDQNFKTTNMGASINKTYAVDLVNGENVFKVVVVNYQSIESRPDHFKVTYTGQVLATSSLHMLVIGINQYMNAAYNFNYAKPDASAFAEVMSQRGHKLFKSINKIELYDANATKETIIKALKDIAAKAKPEDVFVFYYAGHGSLDEEHKDAEGDSPFYFVPSDVTKMYGSSQLVEKGLSSNEMRKYLTDIKSTKQIVLMDACHSGGALKNMSVRAAGNDEKAIIQLARSSGVVWIASSGSKQFATEFDVLKHGVFTYALLEAFNGKGDNGDHKLTANELKFYMEERVPELTQQYGGQSQYPTGYMNGNDFPLTTFE